MKRKTFKVRRTIVGSSDFSRVKSHRADLELNHKEFVKNVSLMAIEVKEISEPSPDTLVRVLCGGKYILCEYKVVKAAKYNNYTL
jgi:hypothetical protein